MLTKSEFVTLVDHAGPLVIDGALATELEARGHDLNHALWSAKVLQEQPESIQQLHLDYFRAGADLAITASYQASAAGLLEHFQMSGPDSALLIQRSVSLAQQAREEASRTSSRQRLVAGSVGPYGAYLADGSEYRGDYVRTPAQFKDFHRPRLQALIDAGVDLLAIETMPSLPEIRAVLDLLQAEFSSTVAWVSCTVKDAYHMSDGEPLRDLVKLVGEYADQVVAIGINCIPMGIVSEALRHLAALTSLPLLCYPNSGETWNAEHKAWTGVPTEGNDWRRNVEDWKAAGASLIGGCCRTGPKDIEAISTILRGQ